MTLQTLKNIPDLQGKKVIVRVDFNVPLDESGNIRNDDRIRFALPTLQHLLDQGASQLILMTHVGRPKNNEPALRTDKMAARLGELLNTTVAKLSDWGEHGLPEVKVVLLENLRFHPAEKSKDESERDAFGRQLASLADLYVNEAFSNSHRKHASMTSVPKFIPGYAGFGVEKEAEAMRHALENPRHPVVAVIAGAKADKLAAIHHMSGVADTILVGGALAFALREAQGVKIGASKVDREGMNEMADVVQSIAAHDKVMLPDDAVVADAFAENAAHKIVGVNEIPEGWMALDIGPKTAEKYAAVLKEAKTILWFGPMGVFEWSAFAEGTKTVGKAIAEADAFKVVGGGDSATAVKKFGFTGAMNHVSTGGGASLEMLEGKPFPALEILKR